MIEPVFEELAQSKGQQQVASVKVNLGVGMGLMVTHEYGIAATLTFGFFLDGRRCVWSFGLDFFMWLIGSVCSLAQIHELKGVNAPELRTQIDLLYQAFPRKLIFGCVSNERHIVLIHSLTAHPHVSLDLLSISYVSLYRTHLVRASPGL